MSREIRLGEVPCQVSQGAFTHEIGVLIILPDGQKISGVFDSSYAIFEKEPEGDVSVDGRFCVGIIEENKDTVLIEITCNPNQHLSPNSPSRVLVPKDFLLPPKISGPEHAQANK
jgi:hypothetical protein